MFTACQPLCHKQCQLHKLWFLQRWLCLRIGVLIPNAAVNKDLCSVIIVRSLLLHLNLKSVGTKLRGTMRQTAWSVASLITMDLYARELCCIGKVYKGVFVMMEFSNSFDWFNTRRKHIPKSRCSLVPMAMVVFMLRTKCSRTWWSKLDRLSSSYLLGKFSFRSWITCACLKSSGIQITLWFQVTSQDMLFL